VMTSGGSPLCPFGVFWLAHLRRAFCVRAGLVLFMSSRIFHFP